MKTSIKPLLWLISGAICFGVASCDGTELEELLVDPNQPNPGSIDLEFVFNSVQTEMPKFLGGFTNGPGDGLPGGNGAYDITNQFMRYINMGGGNQYNNAFFGQSYDFIWSQAYSEILPDIESSKNEARKRGRVGLVGVSQVYEAMVYLTLVDLFGEVPFTEALQGAEVFNPSVSEGAVVYEAMLNNLDSAILNFRVVMNTVPLQTIPFDLIYDGDASTWIKAANSLKLKALLNLRLVDAGQAKSGIEAIVASGEFIDGMSSDFVFPYSTQRNNTNSRSRHYSLNYETGAGQYIGNQFMFDMLTDYSVVDPRLRYYVYRQDTDATDEDFFTLECQTNSAPGHFSNFGDQPYCTANPELGYWGRDHGNNDGIPPDDLKRSIPGVFPAGGAFDDDSAQGVGDDNGAGGAQGAGILPIVMSSFVDFMRAEAALTLGTNGEDAKELLLSAVESSFTSVHNYSASFPGITIPDTFSIVGGRADDVEQYLSEVGDAYDDADDDGKLNVIGQEYYKALWLNGLEAYNLYRRTGKPENLQPTREPNGGDFPRSNLYPTVATTLNSNISQRAITDQVFWDTNPAGFIY